MIEGLEKSLGFDRGIAWKRIDRFAKEEKSRRIEVLLTTSVFYPWAHDVERTDKREKHWLQIESWAISWYTINDPPQICFQDRQVDRGPFIEAWSQEWPRMLPRSAVRGNKPTSAKRILCRKSYWLHAPVVKVGKKHCFDVCGLDWIDAWSAQRFRAEGIPHCGVSSCKLW